MVQVRRVIKLKPSPIAEEALSRIGAASHPPNAKRCEKSTLGPF